MSFFEELRRRNVFRVGLAYVLMGWVLLQGADFVLDVAGAPDWVIRTLIVVVALGLPIALFFAWAFEVTPEGIKREKDIDRSASITPETGRKLDKAIIAFLAIAVVLLLGERFFFTGGSAPATGPVPREETATAAQESTIEAPDKSVAVLPFADMSQGQDQEWFADGLAEEILNALVRVPDLQVASRTSAFGYKGTTKDISQIAEELGVAHVLEGSVRSGGDRIRVTAQLIRAEDGFHVWSETYDRAPEDMIAIQEDLALSIAEALETTMDPEELATMARVGTRSVEAYRAYLRAVAASFDGGTSGTEVLQALEHFQAATDADPRFAAAYLGEAAWWKAQLTPSYLGAGATELDVDALMARFTAAIDQAISNADSPADRQGYLAQKAEVEVRLRDAIRLYEEYLDSRPNDLDALFGLGTAAAMASNTGARDTALAKIRERGQRDPDAAIFYVSNAYESDPGATADYGLERLAQWPDNRGLLYQVHRALAWAGRTEEAASIKRRHDLSYPESPLMAMRQACMEGRREDAEAAMGNIARGDDDRWRTTVWLALKMLGRDREATDVLRPIAASSASYQIASQLIYGVFDPSAFPELMNVLEREGVLRPPPRTLPYQCPPPDETSIAVLPFVNMSSDPEQEYFSDGISEEILNALAQVPDLKVAGRTSSFAFKGRNEDLRTIGETLGVNHILEGSVRKAGDRVRITAQLIKADDGFHVWSETFDRELTDVFAIQDEIAGAILAALETELLAGRSLQAAEVDMESYDRFLQARQLMRNRNEASIQRAAMLLDQVRETAPDYAPAYAQRAIAELLLVDSIGSYGSIPAPEAIANAEPWIERALALDPDLPDAHAALGLARQQERRNEEALAALDRALALSPNHVDANNWRYIVLSNMGLHREAHEQALRVNRLDPLYVPAIGNVSFGFATLGEPERIGPFVARALPYLEGAAKNYAESVRAFGLGWNGDIAASIQLTDRLPPDQRPYANGTAFWGYFGLIEYERALPYMEGRAALVNALSRLGRPEEAIQHGQRFLALGEGVADMIQVLAENQRFDDLITFVESRFGDAEGLASHRFSDGFGAGELGHLAQAYRLAGRETDADEALALFREAIERQAEQGIDNAAFFWSRAHLAMLEGDEASALDHLERAVDRGYLEDNNFVRYWTVFRPLLGNPRLDALIAHMNDLRNEQRALLDLPPLEVGA